jgi:hypothetical protein
VNLLLATAGLYAATVMRRCGVIYLSERKWSDSFISFVTETTGNASVENVCTFAIANRYATGCIRIESTTKRF